MGRSVLGVLGGETHQGTHREDGANRRDACCGLGVTFLLGGVSVLFHEGFICSTTIRVAIFEPTAAVLCFAVLLMGFPYTSLSFYSFYSMISTKMQD